MMTKAKLFVGYFFILIGVASTATSIYLLQDARLTELFNVQQNIKIEVTLLLIFSLLLTYSGIRTIQKEYKKNKLKQSELLDD